MGLDTTHDCWHGSCHSFHLWRCELARLAGISLPLMAGFYNGPNQPVTWESLEPDPLHILLNHSDCDGEIAWQDCTALADRLEELLPQFKAPWHRDWQERTEEFIKGLRLAASLQENVEFH